VAPSERISAIGKRPQDTPGAVVFESRLRSRPTPHRASSHGLHQVLATCISWCRWHNRRHRFRRELQADTSAVPSCASSRHRRCRRRRRRHSLSSDQAKTGQNCACQIFHTLFSCLGYPPLLALTWVGGMRFKASAALPQKILAGQTGLLRRCARLCSGAFLSILLLDLSPV
jgi:hypothetical protein